MKRRSHLLLYLLLNVLVSAVTILTVLVVWDNLHKAETGSPLSSAAALAGVNSEGGSPLESSPVAIIPTEPPTTPIPTETLPPVDTPLIEIVSVVGAGDLEQEVVMLRRVGEGNLRMAGWTLQGEHNNAFVFPNTPELILYKGGAVQLFSRGGTDAATEIYLNRDQPAWRGGETIRLLDPQGAERAVYKVP